MGSYFRALVIDYDGTLAEEARPSEEVLEALGRVRLEAGLRVVLVTGRILAELRSVFADFADHFDMVVAENGAVLYGEGVARALTAPVPVALDEALIHRGIPFRRGQVLLACSGEHDVAVLEDLRRLGLDSQIARNRSELMVLPPGITKAGGVEEALAQLGISRHSAVAVGDAENDLTLLEACELGIAVANAVPSLKERADVVLGQPDGAGLLSLLTGPLVRDELRVEPSRWQLELGVSAEGEPVALPGSRVNLLITGGSGSGKSYAAGFLAERLILLGYSVCLFDPEGDHGPLGRLHNVVGVGGREGLPAPPQLARVLQRSLGSVVVDLSFAGPERESYLKEVLEALERLRSEAGVPHWIFIDEAHAPLGLHGVARRSFDPAHKGLCFVTYRPMDLCPDAFANIDFLLAMPGEHGVDPEIREFLTASTGIPADNLRPELTGVGLGQAVLVRLAAPARALAFSLAPRWVEHVRHWHKYAGARLPPARRFYFRNAHGAMGPAVANLAEFHHELRRCREDVLRHHAARSDFSRWIEDVIQDAELAGSFHSLEARLEGVSSPDAEAVREALLEAIEDRYLA
jgi:hydroxymethylpyrimidine pyrophosphatase-like HAD family hydrolase